MARALAFALSVTLMPLPLLVPAAALADERLEPAVGARIRVTAPDFSRQFFQGQERRFEGRLLSADEETLRVEIRGHEDLAVVPRSAVQRLEISRAPSKRSKGALIGFLVGATVVAVPFLAIGLSESGCGLSCYGSVLLGSTIVGGLPSALTGAALAPGERWEDVAVDEPPVRVGIGPAPGGGVGIAVQWSFGARPQKQRLARRRVAVPSTVGPPAPVSLMPAPE